MFVPLRVHVCEIGWVVRPFVAQTTCWFSSMAFQVAKCGHKGKGVIATKAFGVGSQMCDIMEWQQWSDMVNHSCDPNTEVLTVEGKQMVTWLQNIVAFCHLVLSLVIFHLLCCQRRFEFRWYNFNPSFIAVLPRWLHDLPLWLVTKSLWTYRISFSLQRFWY